MVVVATAPSSSSASATASEDAAPAKKVKVQVGSRYEPSPNEVISSLVETLGPSVHIANSSSRTLAELCEGQEHRKKRKITNQLGDSQLLAAVMPRKAVKASARSAAIPIVPSSSSSQSAKDLGPRVEVIDGKIVLRESSLTVEAADHNAAEAEYEEVEEGAHASSRYSSYSTKRHGKMWGIEETRQFYQALRQCGTEFSMMQTFFPHRTRRELKLKFRREESAHPTLVHIALTTQVPLQLLPFEVSLGMDLAGAADAPPKSPATQPEE